MPNPDIGEDIQLVKLHLEEAVAKVMSGEINNAATMIGIFMLDNLVRGKRV
jgi:hypothetical protein